MTLTNDINVVRSEFRKSNSVYVFVASSLYAALYTIQLIHGLSYQFDRYRYLNGVPLLVFVWMFATTCGALRIDWKRTHHGKRNGLTLSLLTVVLSATLLFAFLHPLLPDVPVTQMTVESLTARTAYLKDIFYALILPVLFVLPTFHFVVLMQSEIEGGRRQRVSAILISNKVSALGRGAIYPRCWILLASLMGLMAFFLVSRAHLLDQLMPSPYQSLFVNLLHVKQILYFGLAIFAVTRYYRSLETLRVYSKIPLSLLSISSTTPAVRRRKQDSPLTVVLIDANASLGDLQEEYASSIKRSGRCLAMIGFLVRLAHALPGFVYRSIFTVFRK